MKKRILIIDDDTKLGNLLTDYLQDYDFKIFIAAHPQKGLKILKQENIDLIILDIMLPDKDGLTLCKEIRLNYHTPIIMLTARGEVTDRIVGLEMGADDYLPKPFEPRELVARIQSILRRVSPNTKQDVIQIDNIKIDFNLQSLMVSEQIVDITTMEFKVLALFMKNPGRVFNRDQIMENNKGLEWEAFDRSIDVLISRLRKKLKDNPKKPKYIKTVWGSGYVFLGKET